MRVSQENIHYDEENDEHFPSPVVFIDDPESPLRVDLLSKTSPEHLRKIDPECSVLTMSVSFLREQSQEVCDWLETEESVAFVCGEKTPERQQLFSEESDWLEGAKNFDDYG